MGLIKNEFLRNELLNVVEWTGFEEDMLFFKWDNDEIKKNSKLIIRPGQVAVFMANGVIEGRFEEPGSFDIETEIVPFLSTLKGFKFGFDSGMRAEVLFINTRRALVKWGTQQPILLPYTGMPGGLPVRLNGTFEIRVKDYDILINNIAGAPAVYRASDLKERVMNALEPAMIDIVSAEGEDVFNIQAKSREISEHIKQDIDESITSLGLELVGVTIRQVSYPKEIQDRINQNAGVMMFGDINKMQQVAFADGLQKGGTGTEGAGMMMGLMMGQQMMANQQAQTQTPVQQAAPVAGGASPAGSVPKFCPECGTPTNGAKFCSNCGTKLA